MSPLPPRLLPDEPLPPYAHVPGQTPHPISDPRGHSFGQPHAAPAALDPSRWAECRDYLLGLDLFNHGYYWESHEHLEGLWHAAGRRGPIADHLKALIRLAAAGVKHREGRPDGVASHAARAAELFRTVLGSQVVDEGGFLGFRLDDLVELAEAIHREGWPSVPPVLLPILSH